MNYVPRFTAPSKDDKHYYSNDNFYYAYGVGMPNCTAYVWGRLYEITGKRYNKLKGDGEKMYDNASEAGLKTGNEPKLGSIICWKQGKSNNSKDGAGHVAVVEEIKTNGDLVCSQSHYNGVEFDLVTITKESGYIYKEGFELQGFIYCGLDFSTPEEDLVRMTYIDILDRMADTSGLNAYSSALRNGMSEETFRNELIDSAENKGDLNSCHKRYFIIKCYKEILGRYPESEAVVKSRLKMNKQEIFNAIWYSEEARKRRGC